MSILFQPDLLFTNGSFQAGAGLLVNSGGHIERIVASGEIAANTTLIHLPGKALLPGFVNTHSHSFQRLIRGRTESRRRGGRDFWSWRGAMYHASAALTPDEIYGVARMAFLEMALAGTTAVGEFHYVHRQPDGRAYSDPNLLAHQVIAAAKSVGIRIALLRTAYQRAGFKMTPDPGQTRFLESTEEFFANTAVLCDQYHSPEAWVGVAPHSVRALPVDAIEEIAAWARERDLPVHMHVSEQMAEVDACEREYGTTPVRLLGRHNVLSSRFTAVHAIHIDPEEMDLLVENGAGICACPTTERNLGDGIFPAREVMAHRIPVALGSDSQAQIEPLEDARQLEYHLRLQYRQRSLLDGIDEQEVSARLLRCATANGAAALGCQAGELEPGKLADFFTVDLNDSSIMGNSGEDLLPMIVFGMRAAAIADLAVGGRFLVRDHRHPLEQEILTEYEEVARKVWPTPQVASEMKQ